MAVVEFQIQMMRLQVGESQNGWNRARKLAKPLEDVLRLQCNTFFEFLTVYLSAFPYSRAVLPGARGLGMKRTAGTELALCESLDSSAHIWIMRRAKAFEHSGKAGRIGYRPPFVSIIAEA